MRVEWEDIKSGDILWRAQLAPNGQSGYVQSVHVVKATGKRAEVSGATDAWRWRTRLTASKWPLFGRTVGRTKKDALWELAAFLEAERDNMEERLVELRRQYVAVCAQAMLADEQGDE